MAKVTLVNGTVKSISGRLGNMIYKTYKNGTTKAYLYHKAERSTPLSEKEIAARILFSTAASETKRRIAAGDTRRRSIIFKEVYAALKQNPNGGISKAERRRNGGKCDSNSFSND